MGMAAEQMEDPLGGAIMLPDEKITGPQLPVADERRQCAEILSGDRPCGFPALQDSTYCARHHVYYHNSQTRDMHRFREQMMINARHDLLRLIPKATDTLARMLDSDDIPANVQLKAATEVYDRVGIRGGTELDIKAEVSSDPAADIRRRLDAMRDGLIQASASADPVITVHVEPEPESEIPSD